MSATPPAQPERSTQSAASRRHPLVSSALFMGQAGRRLMLLALGLLTTLVVLASVAWGVLLWQILPRIDDWRLDLAEQATRSLGVTVRLGEVRGHAEGIWPMLMLRQVQLLDEQGRVALSLPEVSARVSLATLSPQALWAGEVRLSKLELVRPELDVRRDAQGFFHVAGLKLSPQASSGTDGSAGADWVLSQSLIQISGGTVRWTDELKKRPTLSLQQVDLALRHRLGLGRRHHELALAATPPAEFGQRVQIQADIRQPLWALPTQASWWQRWWPSLTRPSQWATWSGSAKVNLPYVDVQNLQRHVVLPVEVTGGKGAVQAEVRLSEGHPSGVSLQLAVQDVRVRLGAQLAPLSFKRLSGELVLDHQRLQTSLSFSQLAFSLDDGLAWPTSQGRLMWRHAPADADWWPAALGVTTGGQAQAEHLDLALLAQVADRLPLADGARARLAELAPRGVVSGLDLSWDGALSDPRHYRVQGKIAGLGLAESAAGMRPGLARADVTVTADESGGRAELSMTQGWLAFPGVFEEPRIPLAMLKARVDWSVKPAAKGSARDWVVAVKQASFANDDASGQLEATWRTGTGELDVKGQPMGPLPGVLAMTGKLTRGEASRVWRYLPLSIPQSTRDYVRQAMRSGRGENVSFEVTGDLNQFPFKDDAGGRFRVNVPMRNVVMDYVPPAMQGVPVGAKTGFWPSFTSLQGMLRFEGQRMVIEDARGLLGTMGTGRFALSKVAGRIEDIGADDPHLTIQGEGAGPLDDLVRFLAVSPVGGWTGGVLSAAQSSGTGAMALSLDIPLNRADDTKLTGQVTLTEKDQASLRLNPSVPQFSGLRGTIAVTESQLNVQARTRVWGHETVLEGKRRPDGVVHFTARGSMSAEGLRQAQEYPVLAGLAQHLSGEAPVAVEVTVGRHAEVQVSSTLQGMAANLPAPLSKPAQAIWPLNVTHRMDDERGQHDALIVELGNPKAVQMTAAHMPWLRVDLRRDVSGDTARVTRGTMSLIESPPGGAIEVQALPAQGVAAQWVAPTLDLDAWQKVAGSFQALGGDGGASSGASSYVPDTVSIKTDALTFKQRTLKEVSATVAHPSPGVWRLQLASEQVAGQVEWVPERAPLSTGPSSSRVIARLSRLAIPNAEAQALQAQAAEQMLSAEAVKSLPALDIQIEQFEWRGVQLGRLDVEALNRLVPVAGGTPLPEWRLTRFRLSTPEAQLDASGNWAALGAQSSTRPSSGSRVLPRSAFGFTLDLQNSGGLLTRLGLPQTLRGGKGQLTGQVSWLGSPLEPDPASMTGDVKVKISEGQFLKADPGIAKLLGVLSLQSLPRRLTLDFRDLFQQGFAFDAIDGDVKITQGVADTRNLRMRGVQAVVLMEGQADLSRETQNLHVFVIPQINAEAASLAYAVINPVVGLGTFVAQYFLRKQVADAGTQEFLVTGSWADPQVEKVGGLTKPRKPF